MRFVPYEELGDRPNIIVDGPANAHTVLTLSHWPQSATPDALRDDLSTQIVFRYLDGPEFHVDIEAVSNNHFDEDGLVGIYALLEPGDAGSRRPLLIDIAAAGDFATYRLRDAARAAFVLSAFGDPERSPLPPQIFRQPYPKIASGLYREMLPRVGDIVSDVEAFRPYWEAEDARLTESEALIAQGAIEIEEFPALDLAVVTVPAQKPCCHPMALHNVISCFRVLTIRGNTYELQYRYESWVRYMSRRPLRRLDLSPLADRLSAIEAGNAQWTFDGADEITPKLAIAGATESSLPPEHFVAQVTQYLFQHA
jgi:hypothetical protein